MCRLTEIFQNNLDKSVPFWIEKNRQEMMRFWDGSGIS